MAGFIELVPDAEYVTRVFVISRSSAEDCERAINQAIATNIEPFAGTVVDLIYATDRGPVGPANHSAIIVYVMPAVIKRAANQDVAAAEWRAAREADAAAWARIGLASDDESVTV